MTATKSILHHLEPEAEFTTVTPGAEELATLAVLSLVACVVTPAMVVTDALAVEALAEPDEILVDLVAVETTVVGETETYVEQIFAEQEVIVTVVCKVFVTTSSVSVLVGATSVV